MSLDRIYAVAAPNEEFESPLSAEEEARAADGPRPPRPALSPSPAAPLNAAPDGPPRRLAPPGEGGRQEDRREAPQAQAGGGGVDPARRSGGRRRRRQGVVPVVRQRHCRERPADHHQPAHPLRGRRVEPGPPDIRACLGEGIRRPRASSFVLRKHTVLCFARPTAMIISSVVEFPTHAVRPDCRRRASRSSASPRSRSTRTATRPSSLQRPSSRCAASTREEPTRSLPLLRSSLRAELRCSAATSSTRRSAKRWSCASCRSTSTATRRRGSPPGAGTASPRTRRAPERS